jgi:hypothetical protein
MSFASVVAGLVLVDPPVAGVDGKPVRENVLSVSCAARNEGESEREPFGSHNSLV